MKNHLTRQLSVLRESGLYRAIKTVSSDQGPEIAHEGKKYLNFSSNNYLGLADHPSLTLAAIDAAKKYGTGSGASRLITGSMSLHQDLEKKIANFKGTEAAVLFNSGYHANIGIIAALMGQDDLIFSDELNHASLIDGCRLSRATTHVYRHGDMGHLETLLRGSGIGNRESLDPDPQKLIITDTVFSMDGDIAPLLEILNLAEKYNAWLLVDEAHATGVFGERGRGIVEHLGIDSQHPRLIQMGTLGKALGSFGAYVCGPKELTDFLINRARSFIYTTSLPPAVLGASIAALDLISKDTSLKEKLWENVEYFEDGFRNISCRGEVTSPLQRVGISPIFPLIIGDSKKTMKIAEQLFERGIWAHGIRPPTVPEGTARIRLTLMATHTREHLDLCLKALRGVLGKSEE